MSVSGRVCVYTWREKKRRNDCAAIDTAGDRNALDMSRERNRQIVPRKRREARQQIPWLSSPCGVSYSGACNDLFIIG